MSMVVTCEFLGWWAGALVGTVILTLVLNPASKFPSDVPLKRPATEYNFSHPHDFLLPTGRKFQDPGSTLSPVFQIFTLLLALSHTDDLLPFFLPGILLSTCAQPTFSKVRALSCCLTTTKVSKQKWALVWQSVSSCLLWRKPFFSGLRFLHL